MIYHHGDYHTLHQDYLIFHLNKIFISIVTKKKYLPRVDPAIEPAHKRVLSTPVAEEVRLFFSLHFYFKC